MKVDLRPVAFEDTYKPKDTRPIFRMFRRGASGPAASTAEKTRKGTDPDILSVPARLKVNQKPIQPKRPVKGQTPIFCLFLRG